MCSACVAVLPMQGAAEEPAVPVSRDWSAGPVYTPALRADSFVQRWVVDRVEAGARIHHFRLRDNRRCGRRGYDNWNLRQNFIGSVWGLDEKQDYLPRLHINYRIWNGFGLGLSYDTITAKTVDWGNLEKTCKGTDGDVIIRGPLLFAFWRFENRTRFTPGVEIGYVRYAASFDVNPAWAAVAPGYRFEVDDTDGHYFGLGCSVALRQGWSVDCHWRRLYDADVRARAYFTPGPRVGRYGVFPMAYSMFSMGATYRF